MTSPRETIRLGADLKEATFTETIGTKLTVVEVALAASTGVDFLREVYVEREEDDKDDADTNHALDTG